MGCPIVFPPLAGCPAVQILVDQNGDLSEMDVIPNRASLLVFSRRGFIKRMPADLFAAQVFGEPLLL